MSDRDVGTLVHRDVLKSPAESVDLAEHVQWVLSKAKAEKGYPQKVTVEVTVEEVDDGE